MVYLFLSKSTYNLYVFCGADWAECTTIRCNTTCFCVYLGANYISWSSKKKIIIARSSAKTKYRVMASATTELT